MKHRLEPVNSTKNFKFRPNFWWTTLMDKKLLIWRLNRLSHLNNHLTHFSLLFVFSIENHKNPSQKIDVLLQQELNYYYTIILTSGHF